MVRHAATVRQPRRRLPGVSHPLPAPLLLLTPAALVLIGVVGFPWAWSLVTSFTRWSAMESSGPKPVGLHNYADVLTDGAFWHSVGLTALLVGITVPAEICLGFAIAYLLNKDRRGTGIFQILLILPWVVVPVMAGFAWRLMLHPQYGVITYLSHLLHLPTAGWLTQPHTVIFTAIIVEVWRHTPIAVIILLAGLRSVPPDILNAGRADGCGELRLIRHIVIGSIRPFIVFATVTAVMFEIRSFDIVYGLFQSGGPGDGANVLGMYLYNTFTTSLDFGRSSAVAYLLLIITFSATAWMARGAFKRVDE
ncbi:carbohydrate ABC transporter permease [Actinoallomurus iriomotensis]|uniref:ABC transporter permease n=1 Tax=Actinoallomurus iriomotensis TaxID=478107 RepID=A0A9W6W5Q5_9ACTN|nr:sugar ABC transporter permease [Actinoallomurus iriomotensis]GLY92300.1 ABC transporter permease [Actinoallomurus iriomotensis]